MVHINYAIINRDRYRRDKYKNGLDGYVRASQGEEDIYHSKF